MPLFFLGDVLQWIFKRENGPLRHSGKGPLRRENGPLRNSGKGPLRRESGPLRHSGKGPISADGQFSGTPPWSRTAPLNKPIKRSMTPAGPADEYCSNFINKVPCPDLGVACHEVRVGLFLSGGMPRGPFGAQNITALDICSVLLPP